MNKPPLMKSGRCLMVAAVAALVPLTAAQADDRDYRSYDQGTSGAQGPMRSDIESSTPTYSGEDRRQFQDETPGAQGPARSEFEAQGYTGGDQSMAACPKSTSETFAPNAYYGEGSPLYSAQGMASLQGRGRWC